MILGVDQAVLPLVMFGVSHALAVRQQLGLSCPIWFHTYVGPWLVRASIPRGGKLGLSWAVREQCAF